LGNPFTFSDFSHRIIGKVNSQNKVGVNKAPTWIFQGISPKWLVGGPNFRNREETPIING